MDATTEMCLFNMDDGFLEGTLRGIKGGLLTRLDYGNLAQCDGLDGMSFFFSFFFFASANNSPKKKTQHSKLDVKMHLQGTKYGQFLANEAPPIATTTIQNRATEKLVEEFKAMRAHANQPLAQFLDFVTYGYMVHFASPQVVFNPNMKHLSFLQLISRLTMSSL